MRPLQHLQRISNTAALGWAGFAIAQVQVLEIMYLTETEITYSAA